MSEASLVLGIDNGLNGGLCLIAPSTRDVVGFTTMPTKQVKDKREVDPKALLRWLDEYRRDTLLVAIEEPLRHAASSQAMRSMAISFGKIVGLFEAKDIEVERVQVRDWQRAILGKNVPAGKTKQVALQRANEIWPDEQWLANSRCRSAHDGIVDAALIAHFCIEYL